MKADAAILENLYTAENYQEIADIYTHWAQTYDEDLNEDSDYVAPQWCLNLLEKYVPSKDAHLLDAGAGTGLFGQLLHQSGYHNIVGIDVSEGMLEQARNKGFYLELQQEVLGEPLGFPDDYFDATISVGVFSPGQGPSSAFEELIRITKPGGYIIFTLRPEFYNSVKYEFKVKQLCLEYSEKWSLEEKTEKFQGLPKGESDLFYHIWVYKVC